MANGHKQTIVGNFFEQVGHKMFGGDLTRNENGDLCLWRDDLTIEVKSSGVQSSYGFRLDVGQIENYERLAIFPFTRAIYLFFAYQNPTKRVEGGKKSTGLSWHSTSMTIHQYLADTVSWCVAVDLSIVSGWKAHLPKSTKSILGHPGTETVDIKCREMHEYANGGLHARLQTMGIDPARFGVLEGKVKLDLQPDLFGQYTLKFPMTAILPRAETVYFKKALRRRGLRLNLRQTA